MVKTKVDQPENPLFTNGENHQMNACVGDNGGPYNLFDYGRGFFEGGHAAVKSAQDYIGPVDLLVYARTTIAMHASEGNVFTRKSKRAMGSMLPGGLPDFREAQRQDAAIVARLLTEGGKVFRTAAEFAAAIEAATA
ncbi:MAG: hypothetical protein ACKOVA_14230 [Novosphingobium sp.]